MIVFNLDAKPLNQDLRFCDDYSAKIIKSAISIPLLKYNIIKQKIERSLCNVVKMSSTKLVLKVNEFWFDDGEILTPKHIKNTIKYLLQTSNHARTLLFDVKKIRIKSDTIIFHHKKILNLYMYLQTSCSALSTIMAVSVENIKLKNMKKIILLLKAINSTHTIIMKSNLIL